MYIPKGRIKYLCILLAFLTVILILLTIFIAYQIKPELFISKVDMSNKGIDFLKKTIEIDIPNSSKVIRAFSVDDNLYTYIELEVNKNDIPGFKNKLTNLYNFIFINKDSTIYDYKRSFISKWGIDKSNIDCSFQKFINIRDETGVSITGKFIIIFTNTNTENVKIYIRKDNDVQSS